MERRFISLLLATLLIVAVVPIGASAYSGYDYASGALGSRLNTIINSGISGCVSPSMPAVGGALNNSQWYTTSYANQTGTSQDKQCQAYARAAYSYIFGYNLASTAYRREITSAKAKNSFDYAFFLKNGIRCGAYLRTTPSSSGTYNGSDGHSIIILSYNSSGITTLEGNADGKGKISILNYSWSNFNYSAFGRKNRYVCSLSQPTDEIYNSLTSDPIPPDHPTLRDGSTGDAVVTLQNLLNSVQNAGLAVDGKYGPATVAAVKKFQQAHELTVDGVCGPNTWSWLEAAAAVGRTSKPSVSVSGQNVTVSWTYSGSGGNTIGVYLIQSPWGWNDVKYEQGVATNVKSCTFTNVAPGFYQAFIVVWPNDASVQSEWSELTVQQPHTTHTKGSFVRTDSAHPHYNYYSCTVCGKEFTDGSTTKNNSCTACHWEHNWTTGTVTVAPTISKPGTKTYTCTICGGTRTEALPQLTLPFTDVSATQYYSTPVAWAVANGVTTGTGATTFSPNNSCTRAQIVTFLWRSLNNPTPSKNSSFTDVASGAYYVNAVNWAVGKGVTNGTGKNTFSPDKACTRAEAVTFIWRAMGKPSAAKANTFNDVPSNAYYTDAVNWAVSEGITNGTGKNTFSPNDVCSRGQIVTFIYRSMGK